MLRQNVSPRAEASALFLSHGVADGLSTVIAAGVVGHGPEANPLMRQLLASHWALALGVMLGGAFVASTLWIVAQECLGPWRVPSIVPAIGAGIGLAIAVGNLWIVVGAV